MKPRDRTRKPAVEPTDLRVRAEASVKARKARPAAARTDVETARLVHELEVHKIELEMQNAELQSARDEVESALMRYTDLYEFAPAGYFSIDESGTILEANLAGAALLGTQRPQLVHRQLEQFITPSSRPDFRAFLVRVFGQANKQICDVSIRREDDVVLWADFQATCAAALRGDARWCRVSASDITTLKRAAEAVLRAEALAIRNRELAEEIARREVLENALRESEREQVLLLARSRLMQEQLRELSHGILHAQESERKRVSRELHDNVAHAAIGINLHLEMLSRESTGKSTARKRKLAETKALLAEFVEVVHRFSRELRPTLLDDLGLVAALRSFTKEFAKRTKLTVRFTSEAEADQLDVAGKTTLYRVAQEALTNVAKHANATRVDIRLQEKRGSICLEVCDDGKAFEVAHVLVAGRQRRLGLLGMRERLEMVGGTFEIESAPGTGTCVRAVVPLPAAADPPTPAIS
ncbi:MAG: PAS domain S-box protein [Planctomycetes bacterium]|nr:PAS domain S-box protein [Planctomycetota bacterium]